ncbi:hypothetical protein PM082_020694 [Marasmius tenuissimus]|nr:hypothetical protein PM082_000401 [Marasmius tenuissimus]KAJ8086273.1 hypothetical protein PM082_005096 [Marasmius tenuissimus]KAJ8087818.1 hypothetical protein PM082_006668 [Marasmius tenuissimus]KAJ8087870.1 hypothetical protein PM082_006726 [Marasmius tenuissimus]KAJ8087873.1 hypothetical protein PM082_006729 [Marasmius tenuissimus]
MPKVAKNHQFITPVNKRSTTETLQLQQEAREHTQRLSLLARMGLEKRRTLLQRLSSPPPPVNPLSLLERIEYQIPEPIPNHLHFRRTKNLRRIPEYQPLLAACIKRMDRIFHELSFEESQAKLGGPPMRIPVELANRVWEKYDRLQDFYHGIDKTEELGHKMSNTQWRQLKGAIKMFKKVSLHDLKDRLVEICQEIDNLDVIFPDV